MLTSTATSEQASFVATDGLELFYRVWRAKQPEAVVLIAHGYAEHSGRYERFATYLNEHNVSVYALDHRGHGRSEGERANVSVFRCFVNDLARFSDIVREREPVHPRILLGHSMGGVVAAQFVLEHPLKVDALILSAPYLKNAVAVPKVLLALSEPVARFFPSLPTIKIDTSKLSHDKAVVAAYEADPLVYNGATKARMGAELMNAGKYVLERAESVDLPLLVLHGDADEIADPAGAQELFEHSSSSDKTLKLYQGFYHEVLNEPDKEKVYADIRKWLEHVEAST